MEILAAVVALVGIFIWSEGLMHEKVEPGQAEQDASAVWSGPSAQALRETVPVVIEAVGTVRAEEEAELSSRVQGVVDRIAVREGDRVKRGDVLAVISTPELNFQRSAAEGAMRVAGAALEQARRDQARMENLYREGAASRSEWEHAKSALDQAAANLDQARGTTGAASSMASHATMRAPFDGIITERHLDPGFLASPGLPILRIVDDRSFRMEVSVEERQAAFIRRGDSAVVIVDSLSLDTIAEITEVVPASDPQSRTVLVKAALPFSKGLRSGQFGRLRVSSGEQSSVVIPAAALKEAAGLTFVHVLDPGNRISVRYVRPGVALPNGRIEILSGIEPGERMALP